MKPLVSILIPAYRAEKWLGQTLNSAIGQTWGRKEIIVVDDGSPDETLRVARYYESGIVKVVTQANSGACAARNKALSLAQGDYIQWLDADDLLAPDKLFHQLNRIGVGADSRVLLASSFGTFYYGVEKAKFQPSILWQDLEPVEWVKLKFKHNAWMNPAVWLVSRKLTELAGPWDERLTLDDDGEYFCRLVLASEKVEFVPKVKCYYRVGNPSSLSRRRSDSACEGLLLATKLCVSHLLNHTDDLDARAACVAMLENRMWYFYPEKMDLVRELQGLGRDLGVDKLKLIETWKYRIFARCFGDRIAKQARNALDASRSVVRKYWHKLFSGLSSVSQNLR